MKSIILLLIGIVISISLYSKLSYAAEDNTTSLPLSVTQIYIFPSSYAAGEETLQSMVIVPKVIAPNFITKTSQATQVIQKAVRSKNQFFNFSTKFNEKLQQFIAFFKRPQLSQAHATETLTQYAIPAVIPQKKKPKTTSCDNKRNS